MENMKNCAVSDDAMEQVVGGYQKSDNNGIIYGTFELYDEHILYTVASKDQLGSIGLYFGVWSVSATVTGNKIMELNNRLFDLYGGAGKAPNHWISNPDMIGVGWHIFVK